TIRSTLGIILSEGPWLEDGRTRMISAGEETRWAPMPPPLGPKRAVSFPLALGHLAPRHLELRALRLYATAGAVEAGGMRFGMPFLRWAFDSPVRPWIDKIVDRAPEGPTEDQRERSRWTILAEARSGSEWRNVTLQGTDYYGLTAETLTAAAIQMSADGYDVSGVVAPVEATGLNVLLDELSKHGVSIETYAPV
ncbi:MAG: hypothetical protein QOH90_611, partial [Actinomycetota bacterium]|nr:hypothetical protein [Actinomycetota bacterium]